MPIAPTPPFFLRIRLLTASLARFSGLRCRVVVHVSRDVEPFDLHVAEPWSRELGIDWRWMNAESYAEHGMYGTAMVRFDADFTTPFVVLLDADTLCTGSLADLPSRVGDGIGGVMAWVTPLLEPPAPRDGRLLAPERFWQDLFSFAGLPEPDLSCEHPGWSVMHGSPPHHRHAPAYFNLGMLAGTAEAMRAVAPSVLSDLALVDRFVESRFRCQLALSVAAARTGVPLVPLPLRFNFPNSRYFWAQYPDEHDVRLLHYTETEEIDREALTSLTDLEQLAQQDELCPPNALMRERVARLLRDMRRAQRERIPG